MRKGLGLGIPLNLFKLGLARDPALKFRAQLLTSSAPYIGQLSSIDCSNPTTINHFGRQIEGQAHESMHYGARRERNNINESTYSDNGIYNDWGTGTHAVDSSNQLVEFNVGIGSANRVDTGGALLENINIYNKTLLMSCQIRAKNASDVGKEVTCQFNRYSGGASVLVNKTITLTEDWTEYQFGTITSVDAANEGVKLSAWGDSEAADLELRRFFPQDVSGETSPVTSEFVSANVGIGDELVTNGTFDTGITDWDPNDAGAELSYVNGRLRINNGDASNAEARQTVNNLTVGEEHLISLFFNKSSGAVANIVVNDGNLNTGGVPITTGNYSWKFTPTATSVLLKLRVYSPVQDVHIEFDNISIKSLSQGNGVNGVKCFDYEKTASVDANGAVTYGTTLTPIADADLKGIQCGPGATNLLVDSYEFTAASWTTTNASVVDNDSTNLKGLPLMDKLVEDTSLASVHNLKAATQPVVSASTECCVYFVVKKPTSNARNRLRVRGLFNGDGDDVYANFDLTLESAVDNPTASKYGVVVLPNDFYLLWIAHTSGSTSTFVTPHLHLLNNTSGNTYDGDGVTGIYVSSCDVIEGSFPILPIETSGGTASRGPNKYAYVAPTNLVNGFKFPFYYTHQAYDDTTDRWIISSDGDIDNNISVYYHASSDRLRFRVRDTATSYIVDSDAALTVGQTYYIEPIYKDGMSMKIDGVLQADTDVHSDDLTFTVSYFYTGTYAQTLQQLCAIKNFSVEQI